MKRIITVFLLVMILLVTFGCSSMTGPKFFPIDNEPKEYITVMKVEF
jgi:predicted small lipoprotein YifL